MTAAVVLVAGALAHGALSPSAPGSWLTLRTPHLRVHFRPGYEAAALQAARAAEQTIDALGARLGHTPADPIHLALVDVTDLANGFTDPTYYSRVVVFPVFPVGLGYSTGLSLRMEDWLKLVVAHEVVHAVHLDMNEGAAAGLRALLGHVPGLSTPNAFQPPALLEGLATFEETELVTGGRGGDPLFEMFVRTAVLAGRLPEMDQALGIYDLERFQPAGDHYLYGYLWYGYVNRRFGADAIRRLNKRWAGLHYTRVSEATADLMGQPMGELWEQMEADLRRSVERQVEAIEARGVTAAERLPSSGWVVTTPRVSPDGRRIAYAAQGPYVQDVRILDLVDGRDRQVVVALAQVPGGLDWTPDGRQLVYSAVEPDRQRSFADLFAVDVASRRVRRLTRGLRAYAPAVSPDGRWVAFAAREGLQTRLMVVELQGGSPVPQVAWVPPPGWQILSLAWRPGAMLAMSAWRPGGMTDLFLLRPKPEPRGLRLELERQVTADRAVDERPAWSFDGRYLLFHSDRTGVYNLYAYEPQSNRAWQLTNVVTGAFDPAMGPDGTVVFSWFQADGYHLARLPWERLRWEPVALEADPGAPAVDGAGDGGAPEQRPGDALPAGWTLAPYRPVESLAPRFWFPIVDEDWEGLQIGAQTAGLDALGQRAFAAEAAVGLLSGEPRWFAGYQQVLADGDGPIVLVEAGQAPVAQVQALAEGGCGRVWSTVGHVTGAAGWEWPGYTRVAGLTLFARGLSWQLKALDDTELSESLHQAAVAGGAVGFARLRADHRGAAVDRLTLAADTAPYVDGETVPAGELATGLAAAQRVWVRPGGFSARAALAAALIGPGFERSMRLGGDGGPFSLRAFNPCKDRPVLDADAAAGLQLSVRQRLVGVKRGLGDAPLFVDDLGLELFFEAAAGWQWGAGRRLWAMTPAPWRMAADVGAELQLRLALDYGGMGLVLRLGVAVPVEPQPGPARWYLSFQTP